MQPHRRVYAAFFLYALALSSIYPRLGDIQLQMGIGEAALGAALIGPGVGAFISLSFAGPILAKFSHRQLVLSGNIIIAVLMAMSPWAGGPVSLFAILLAAGLVIGALEVVVNLEADRTEFALGRRIMSRCHAFWSFGFFAAGLLGAAAKQVGLSPQLHLGLMVPLVAVATFLLLIPLESAPARPHEDAASPARFAWPSLGLMVVVVFALSALLVEGASADWSAIYMRDTFDAAPFINGLAVAIAALAQAVTRYFADGLLTRLGPVRTARLLITLLAAGVVTVVFAQHAFVALAGFALCGIGASAIFPIAVSAAAQRPDRPAALNVAALSQFAFVAFLLGPPLLGFVAEHWGVRIAYAVCLPLIVLSFAATHGLNISREGSRLGASA